MNYVLNRDNFILGRVLSMTDIAFSQPTKDGHNFGRSYTKTDGLILFAACPDTI